MRFVGTLCSIMLMGPEDGNGGGGGSAEPAPQQPEGIPAAVQARIDEINAQFHNAQRINEQLIAQNNELLAQVRGNQNREVVTEAPVELPEGVDPSVATVLEKVVERATAPLKKQLAEMSGAMSRTNLSARDAQVLASIQPKLAKINNPLVTARVSELVNQWRNDPEQKFAHATPDDALRIAAGEAALGMLGAQEATQNRDDRGRFNANANVLPGAGGRTQQAKPNQQKPVEERLREIPDLNKLSPKELFALNKELDAKYPDGFSIGEMSKG
jgi:hypothetical protein